MPTYLIVRSYCNDNYVSVIKTNNYMEHFLKFRDSEYRLQQNLYIALVPTDYNISKELPQHLKHNNRHNNTFYHKQLLEYLPNNKLVITKKINIIIKYMLFMEKLLNFRVKINLDNDEIYIDYN